ncbi:unnamed protein product [Mytilus edulis]|uniref:Uncharacterized protein n=1 Tax=Mytilus edulis TaxID=6550 RepID=A0A8S3S141_MYTED|nr:unnamed protein product [Mytilus edulis]
MSSESVPYVARLSPALPFGCQHRAFPLKTFKVFGGLQIGLGVLLGILSLVGVILDITAWNKYDDCLANIYSGTTDHYNSGNFYDGSYWTCHRYNAVQALFTFDIICLICSGWYFVTGLLPMCMTKKREAKWMCLKTGFMVCSLIGATNVVPTMFGLGVLGSITRERYDYKTTVNLPVLMAVFSFAEAIVAIVSASFCCCYSTYGISNQQGVVISTQPGLLINSPPTQIPIENRYYCITDQINNRRNSSPYREEQCQLMNPTELKEQLVQAVYGTNPPTYND